MESWKTVSSPPDSTPPLSPTGNKWLNPVEVVEIERGSVEEGSGVRVNC